MLNLEVSLFYDSMGGGIMNCDEVKQILPEYLENDLPESKAAGVFAHLEECGSCRAEAEAFDETWQALGIWEDVEPSPGFTPELYRRLEKPGIIEQIKSLINIKIPAWAMTGIILVGLVAGHFSTTPHYYSNQPVRVVYTPTNRSLADSNGPVRMCPVIPRPEDVIGEANYRDNQDIVPAGGWDDPSPVQRLDVETAFGD